MSKLTITVPVEEIDKAMTAVYNRQKSRISIPGFRKGKAPRRMIERVYGKGVFLEDAVRDLVPDAYEKAVDEAGIEAVSRPKLDYVQVEPEKELIFTAEVATKPEVTLGKYKGLEVPANHVVVAESEVDEEIKREQEKNARTVTVEDRPTKNGDIVTIDYAGTVDGEAFEGGTASSHPLTLGSGSFIPGFEDQLVGANTGDHVEVKVTFPEDYSAEELAGKDAVFAVDVKKIEVKELPQLDDDFAQDVSEEETFEDYKKSVRAQIQTRKEEEARTQKENAAVDAAIKEAQMDIPEAMIDFQVESMMDDFANRMSMQGLSMEQYFKFTGQSMDSMMEQMRPNAVKRIQTRLVLEQIAKEENIQATEEQLAQELEKMASAYRMTVEDVKDTFTDKQLDSIRKDIEVRSAIDLICDAAVEVEGLTAGE